MDYINRTLKMERQKYEQNRNHRIHDKHNPFYDGDYICCSTYGRPRSKGFHWKYYKQLLAETGLPDIRWHDLRSTYCTLLLKQSFSAKAIANLMGHSKEIISINVYGDNRNIIADGVPELEEYIKDVLPNPEAIKAFKEELLEIGLNTEEYLQNTA